MLSLKEHIAAWKDCECCPLWEKRNKIVLGKGKLPCDILFVGEAPGKSENVIGQPFVGPAGHLLDMILEQSIPGKFATVNGREQWVCDLRLAFTNLVACIPGDEDGGKLGQPSDDNIRDCSPRLQEFIEMADPQLLVCVGDLPRDFLEPGYKHSIPLHKKIQQIAIPHPARILRFNISQQGLAIQRCVVLLQNAVEDFVRTE